MKPLSELCARDVMTTPILSIGVDTPVREAAEILSGHGISGALVTGRGGRPVGVISLFDIVSFLAGLDRPMGTPGGFYQSVYPRIEAGGEFWNVEIERLEEKPLAETPVGDIMATSIIAVPPEAPLPEVAALMARKRIHRVFVGGPGGPAGVLSTTDMLSAVGRTAPPRRKPVARQRRKPASRTGQARRKA
jgi:CBS domain-containing protein